MKDTSTPKMKGNQQVFTFDLTMSPIEEANNGTSRCVQVENVNDQKICTETKRLGMGGPSQKIVTEVNNTILSVSVEDIGKRMSGASSVTVKTVDKVEKIVRFRCTICSHWAFTLNGFRFHMFNTHDIRDTDNLSPRLIEGEDICSDSSMPNIVGPSQRNHSKDNEVRPYKCMLCDSAFFFPSSINTHMTHAHSDEGKMKSKTDKKTPTKRKTVSSVKAKDTIKKPKK